MMTTEAEMRTVVAGKRQPAARFKTTAGGSWMLSVGWKVMHKRQKVDLSQGALMMPSLQEQF